MSAKNIIRIAVLAIIVYAGFITHQWDVERKQRIENAKERDEAVKFATNEKEAKVEYINKYRETVVKVRSTEISRDNFRRLRETERLKFLGHIEDLKKNLANLGAAQAFDLSFFGDSIPMTPVMVDTGDSLKVFKYEYKDLYNDIFAMVLDTPRIKIRVPVRSALLWERKNKFLWFRVGKKIWYQEAYSPNKLIKIDSVSVYSVRKK